MKEKENKDLAKPAEQDKTDGYHQVFNLEMDRRSALKRFTGGLFAATAAITTACSVTTSSEKREEKDLNWEEYFKGNYKLMTDEERNSTVERLEKLYTIRTGKSVNS